MSNVGRSSSYTFFLSPRNPAHFPLHFGFHHLVPVTALPALIVIRLAKLPTFFLDRSKAAFLTSSFLTFTISYRASNCRTSNCVCSDDVARISISWANWVVDGAVYRARGILGNIAGLENPRCFIRSWNSHNCG